MNSTLTAAHRKALRAKSHRLKPGLTVGKAGLSDPILEEIRRQVAEQGLLKIRFTGRDGPEIDVLAGEIARQTSSVVVCRTGFVIVLAGCEFILHSGQ